MELPGADRFINLLDTFLDVQSRRAEIIAGNLANADTPGYAAKELEFADFLKRASLEVMTPLKTGTVASSASPLGAPNVVEQEVPGVGIDGNSVDVGRQMSQLADVGTQHLTGTQMLQSRLRTLRAAIREGR
jgi:flagellar basal-body rod protein FlgB